MSFYDTRNGSDDGFAATMGDCRAGIELVELTYWQSRLQQAFDFFLRINASPSSSIFLMGLPSTKLVPASNVSRHCAELLLSRTGPTSAPNVPAT